MAMVYALATSDLSRPPPHALSHHSLGPKHTLPWASRAKRDRTRPGAADLRFILRFVWPGNGKQMDAAEGTDKEEEVEEGGRRKKESKRGRDGPF